MSAAKDHLRAQIVAARRAMTPDVRRVAAAAIEQSLLDLPEMSTSHTVAAYLSFATEPATHGPLQRLLTQGTMLLVPVVRPDRDLDWVQYVGAATGEIPDEMLWEPPGARLGEGAIRAADAIIVPALAVSTRGTRLGRGGGSYDRALARVSAGTPVIALLYDDEVRADVPAEAHDRPVDVAVTPSRVWRFS